MNNSANKVVRALPAVHAILELPAAVELIERYGRNTVVTAVRKTIADLREAMLRGDEPARPECEAQAFIEKAEKMIKTGLHPRLRRVINATGIILHTGLGRAVMSDAARETLAQLTGCCNIQMDLESGKRIKREKCISDLIRDLTGAEDAVLVNNNAGATMLALKALAEGEEVIVSRGELIEIGGSFRLPEIMEQSGAILREVGATNKTHLRDYKKAIGPKTGVLLKVHKSNYQIVGFSKEVPINEIAEVGREHNIPVVDDLGCGALVDLEQFGMEHEMTVRESLESGSDIVLFSTDKLIGGPQGGLIVGRKDLLDRIRAHPLYRTLRVCKMTLAALESTLRLFKAPELLQKSHPVYAMIAKTPEEMETQATQLVKLLMEKQPKWNISVKKGSSYLGGGSLPGSELPSYVISITSENQSADEISRLFRSAPTPVIPRVQDDVVLMDMRTVFPKEIDDVVRAAGTEVDKN